MTALSLILLIIISGSLCESSVGEIMECSDIVQHVLRTIIVLQIFDGEDTTYFIV